MRAASCDGFDTVQHVYVSATTFFERRRPQVRDLPFTHYVVARVSLLGFLDWLLLVCLAHWLAATVRSRDERYSFPRNP